MPRCVTYIVAVVDLSSPFLVTLFASLLTVGSAHASEEPVLEWEAPLSSCIPADLVLDDAGHTYVACRDARAHAVRVLAYAHDGSLLAETALSSEAGREPMPVDLAWERDRLYVAVTSRRGATSDAVLYGLATSDLSERWRASHPAAAAASLVTTGDGGVWLGARSTGATPDLLLASYDATGKLAVDARYDSGTGDAFGRDKRSLAADSRGNLYVAGGVALLRFGRDGSFAWRVEQPSLAVTVDDHDRALVTTPLAPEGQTARFLPDGRRDFHVARGGSDVAVTPGGQIWLAGTRVTANAQDWDLLTTLLESDGRVVFTDRYNGGNQDRFVDLAVDASGGAYVLASSYVRSGPIGVSERYLVLKYTASERRLWTESYGRNGLPAALGVSADGRFVATGYDGTVSWTEEAAIEEIEECPWWWIGCWLDGRSVMPRQP
jgi:hypothetical protein